MNLILDADQQDALRSMLAGKNVFLTGNAGTGKSTVVTQFLAQSPVAPDVTATTGIAALNLRDRFAATFPGGRGIRVSTVYRWAGIGLGPKPNESFADAFARIEREPGRSRPSIWQHIRGADCLVIDEISMLPGLVFGFIDYVCQTLRRNNSPFGGIQIIACGDFLQLPPVSKSGQYDWAFQTDTWSRAKFKNHNLRTIHRQDNPEFTEILNAVRVGEVKAEHMRTLRSRVTKFPPVDIVRLFTHNTQVDKWNGMKLAELDGKEETFLMDVAGAGAENLAKACLSPRELKLKVGARVMTTANISVEGELVVVNGALGHVEDISNGKIVVNFDDGRTRAIERHTWSEDYFDPTAPYICQYPLRLAWACTIHKAQGLSLDAAVIDPRAAREPGQVYVALSRLRSLEGLRLKDTFSGVWVSPAALKFMQSI